MIEKQHVRIAPSIFAADYGYLADEARRIADAGADSIHIDIMDGHFVPNLSFGAGITAAINRATPIFLDVHLMIYNPYEYVERFAEAGADSITIHFEATEDVEETLNYIRRCGIKAGLAFKPETSETMAIKYLNKCDMVLVMTVDPGFGGQAFMPETLDKVQFIRDTCTQLRICQGGIVAKSEEEAKTLPPFDIQVDGGINDETARECRRRGANVLVAGTFLLRHPDLKRGIQELRNV